MQEINFSRCEEEFNLRELIEVLLKAKWFIAIFTTVSLLVSVIYAHFYVTPTYEAKSRLMVSPITVQERGNQNQISNLVDSISQYPQMTLDTYKEQIKTPEVLNAVIKALSLDEKYDMTYVGLARKINIETPQNTNLMYLVVKDADPILAADIANVLSKQFVEYVSEKLQQQTGQTAEFIEQQLILEKEKLEKATAELTAFLARPRGVSELRQELNATLSQLTSFKSKVVEVRLDKEITQAALNQVRRTLQTTPKTLETSKSVATDALLSQIIKELSDANMQDIAGLEMIEEQLNPAYTSLLMDNKNYELALTRDTARIEGLEREIAVKQKQVKVLQAELAEKENELEVLTYEVDMGKQTRDAYQQKLKEANIKQSAEIGRSSVTIVAQALPPIYPTSGKMMIVAIAGVLGIMVSVFFVFFMAYWKSSGEGRN